jgi:hypothetical protein
MARLLQHVTLGHVQGVGYDRRHNALDDWPVIFSIIMKTDRTLT